MAKARIEKEKEMNKLDDDNEDEHFISIDNVVPVDDLDLD